MSGKIRWEGPLLLVREENNEVETGKSSPPRKLRLTPCFEYQMNVRRTCGKIIQKMSEVCIVAERQMNVR